MLSALYCPLPLNQDLFRQYLPVDKEPVGVKIKIHLSPNRRADLKISYFKQVGLDATKIQICKCKGRWSLSHRSLFRQPFIILFRRGQKGLRQCACLVAGQAKSDAIGFEHFPFRMAFFAHLNAHVIGEIFCWRLNRHIDMQLVVANS